MLVALAGALWLAGLAALGALQLGDALPTPDVRGVPVPTALLAGGALAGLLLALLARLATARAPAAAPRGRSARCASASTASPTSSSLEPVQAELAVRDELCAAVAEAAGRRGGAPRGARPRALAAVGRGAAAAGPSAAADPPAATARQVVRARSGRAAARESGPRPLERTRATWLQRPDDERRRR